MTAYDDTLAALAAYKAANDAIIATLTATTKAQAAKIITLTAQVNSPAPITWGSTVNPIPPETYAQALARVETQLNPGVIRYFEPFGSDPTWPTRTGTHPLVVSWKYAPAEVVVGTHDAAITAFFAATPRLTYWSYWHECEDDIARGTFTAADYRAAFRHIVGLARASSKASLLVSTLILMGYTLTPASGRTWTDYYPGSDVIDVLGWDCYIVTKGETPQTAYDAARAASAAAGKPWAICETGVGSVMYPVEADRDAVLTAMSTWLSQASPRPVFVSYFDTEFGPNDQNLWPISNDPTAAAAWRSGQLA